MDDQVQQKLIEAMDGDDTALIPFLPYILQDLWEIGSSPEDMIALLDQAGVKPKTILDLGFGKGPVAVKLSKHFDSHAKGIDLLEDFILYAKEKAQEYQADCEFHVGDINVAVAIEKNHDLVIYGAVGRF